MSRIGAPGDDDVTQKYWWKFITEGVAVGKAMEKIMGEHLGRHRTGYSDSTVESQPMSFTNGVGKS